MAYPGQDAYGLDREDVLDVGSDRPPRRPWLTPVVLALAAIAAGVLVASHSGTGRHSGPSRPRRPTVSVRSVGHRLLGVQCGLGGVRPRRGLDGGDRPGGRPDHHDPGARAGVRQPRGRLHRWRTRRDHPVLRPGTGLRRPGRRAGPAADRRARVRQRSRAAAARTAPWSDLGAAGERRRLQLRAAVDRPRRASDRDRPRGCRRTERSRPPPSRTGAATHCCSPAATSPTTPARPGTGR